MSKQIDADSIKHNEIPKNVYKKPGNREKPYENL